MNYPKVTVVIPVRSLQESDIVINSLKKVDYPKELIESFVIEGTNPSVQRNEAIRKSSGEIIFFFDDDSEIDSQLFKETTITYQKHPEAIGVGGPACLYGALSNIYHYDKNRYLVDKAERAMDCCRCGLRLYRFHARIRDKYIIGQIANNIDNLSRLCYP